LYARWSEHKRSLRQGRHHTYKLQRAWNKHTEAAFIFSVIEECGREELRDREQAYVDRLMPAYNIMTDVKSNTGAEMLARRAATTRARAALITHCPRGHPYNDANTYINAKRKRICRACNAIRVCAVYAAETPTQTEARLQKYRRYHFANRERHLEMMRAYVATHKAEKAAYDRARRAQLKAATSV
jgi:hypothetical protein